MADAQSHWRDTVAIAALTQALVATMVRDVEAGRPLPHARRVLATENRFRASLDGVHGKLIDTEHKEEVETKVLIDRMLEYIEPAEKELGLESHLDRIRWIRDQGSGADRQTAAFEKTLDLHEVAKSIHQETVADL